MHILHFIFRSQISGWIFSLLISPEIRGWGILWLQSSLKSFTQLSNTAHDFEQVARHTSARCLLSHQAAKVGLPSHQINLRSRSAPQPIYFQLRRLGGSGLWVLSTLPNRSLTFLMGCINKSCSGDWGPTSVMGTQEVPLHPPGCRQWQLPSSPLPAWNIAELLLHFILLCCLPKFISPSI